MAKWMINFWQNERGATSIEYALIASIVSISILAVMLQIGPALIDKYQSVSDGFN
jgi:Flp pilus assembly pilin Flp